MSEFTAGLLYLSGDANRISAALEENADFVEGREELDEHWHVMLLDFSAHGLLALADADLAGMNGQERAEFDALNDALKELSKAAPILYFYNAEDHGWGYRLYHQGQRVARADLDYEADYRIAEAAILAQHPGRDIFDPAVATLAAWKAVHDAARRGAGFTAAVGAALALAHPEAFACFGFPPQILQGLFALLDPAAVLAAYRDEKIFTLVHEFKKLLGIEHMTWLM